MIIPMVLVTRWIIKILLHIYCTKFNRRCNGKMRQLLHKHVYTMSVYPPWVIKLNYTHSLHLIIPSQNQQEKIKFSITKLGLSRQQVDRYIVYHVFDNLIRHY